jgi:trans-aconitate 2-methyltransferase
MIWVMAAWNAARYLRFEDERTRPCRDLAARIEVSGSRRVIDLGCGPGNSTAVLAERWPEADLTGLDSSPEMLSTARTGAPAVRWMAGDIAQWAEEDAERFDVVFSNAALQWVPDHAALLPRLLGRVSPGGALGMQIPAYSRQPAQRLIREMAASAQWRARFTAPPRDWRAETPEFYYDVLAPVVSRLDIWETEYLHVLEGPEAVVEWYRGTGLRPFLSALASEEDRTNFLSEYLEGLKPYYPRRADGRVLLPFRRLFAVAYAR